MERSFTDADQWYEEYESATLKEQYEILLKTLDQSLSQDFIEDSDLGGCLVDMMSTLTSSNLIEQALDFIDTIQAKQPEFYKREFQYYDKQAEEYSFVHRWAPPDSVPDKYSAAESEIFSRTIEIKVPLGGKSSKGLMGFLSQFMDKEVLSTLLTPDDFSKKPAAKAAREKTKSGKSSAAKKRRRKKKKKRKR